MKSMSRYLWRILLALDQLGNALLNGDEDETISSRAEVGVYSLPNSRLN